MAALLEKSQELVVPKRGEKITGKVVQVLPDKILVDFGGKSEGEILAKELENLGKLGSIPTAGEEITAIVINPEDESGATILSVRNTTTDSIWTRLEELAAAALEVEAVIAGIAKSGILVEIQGLRGFIPATFVDPETLVDFDNFRGKKIMVIPLEVNRANNRLVCRAVGKQSPEKDRQLLEKKYKKGKKYQGSVSAILPFGLVVSFDNFLSFVPSSELSWERVDDLSAIFKVGESIEFIFLGIDKTTGYPQISVKATLRDPFEDIVRLWQGGKTVKGRVSKVTELGAFVTLANGIEGLAHVSKIPIDLKLEVGQEISCTIDSVDRDQRRISLSPVLKTKPVGYR